MAGAGERAPARPASAAGPRAWAVCLALVATVALVYARTATHGFVSFDDGSYLTENEHVRGGLSLDGLRWAFGAFHSANWHPLTWLSHQLDWQLFGAWAGGHHLVGAGLHALAACLLYLFLARTTAKPWPSVLVAFLFALHPQRVESVAWASERKDVLAGVFFFALLLAHARHAERPAPARLALVAALLALGLLAKPMLVTVPLVLLVLDRWPLARALAPLQAALEKWSLFLLSGASAAVTLLAQRAGGAVRNFDEFDLPTRFATAVLGFWRYVADAVWPVGLAFYYPHPAQVDPEHWQALGPATWFALAGLVALGVLAWRLRLRAPCVPAGLAWMGLMLLPVIGLVQVGAQFVADRYAYLPQVGLILALVFGLEPLLTGAAARRAAWAFGAFLCVASGTLAWRQVGTWQDSVTMATRALQVTERNHVAHQHLGLELQRRRDFQGAREQYLAALAIAPRMHDTLSNLGAVHMQLGEHAEARRRYEEALRVRPGFLDALLNLGLLAELADDLEGALGWYRRAAGANPEAPEAWTKLGDGELATGRNAEAEAAYRHALALRPTWADARAGLAEALLERGAEREALALVAGPELATHVRALHVEARILCGAREPALRDPARAAARLQACPEGAQPGWAHLRALAWWLARTGRFEDAARAVTEASASAPRQAWAALTAERTAFQARRAIGDGP